MSLGSIRQICSQVRKGHAALNRLNVGTVIDVLLPCLDEAEALPWVLARIPGGARAIVIDNGSSDGSAQIAAELGATVITCEQRGYGAACHAGLLAAQSDLVAFCDCDATIDPLDIVRLAEPVALGQADLVVACRIPVRGAGWPLHARLANRELARRVRRRTGVVVRDLGPVRVARREALLGLGLTDRRSGYPLQTLVAAADAGWRITAQDVAYLPRAGRSKVTGTLAGTLAAVRDMRAVLAS